MGKKQPPKLIDLCQISDLKSVKGRFGDAPEKGALICNINGGKGFIHYTILIAKSYLNGMRKGVNCSGENEETYHCTQ